ncbi:MAG: hypothetical protein OIN83_11655 [Candidatus Methanoperedens sp.]|nr:hypothetical protein [Candidatus Methanoperedens sp.]
MDCCGKTKGTDKDIIKEKIGNEKPARENTGPASGDMDSGMDSMMDFGRGSYTKSSRLFSSLFDH